MRAVLIFVLALVAATAGCAGDDAGSAAAAPLPLQSTTTSTAVAPVPVTTTTAVPTTFAARVERVTAADLGASWHPGCPVAADDLRSVDVTHWGFDGAVHHGRLVVAAVETDHVVLALRELFEAHYPIERMEPIDVYGGDDDASMAVNNTSAFNCRTVAGTDRLSEHALGRAIDVNPLVNPYVTPSGVFPPVGTPYADRTRTDPGVIHDGDAVVAAFARQGWTWGGRWSGAKDYQHFSASGR